MSEENYKIHIPALTRVEGEGALSLDIVDGKIEQLKLSIYEPPRLFEQGVIGRYYYEVPDMVARICGICPVAYQMSAVQALESIYGIRPGKSINDMRRLYYCGEWIQSHALHIHLLALPDFLGYENVVAMSADYPEQVQRGLGLQHLGNDIIALLGGRSVNPVGAVVGGFAAPPDPARIKDILNRIDLDIKKGEELLRWTCQLDYPEQQQDFTCVSLYNGQEYPMMNGNLVSSAGLDISIDQFEQHFAEKQVEYSTALHCLLEGEPYLVGPLARINLNKSFLPESVQDILNQENITFPSYNTNDSIVARAAEILCALIEARRLLVQGFDGDYQLEVTTAEGTGFGCTEAPRGVLWHRYSSDQAGKITDCRIVPPTSQNQAQIERDLQQALTTAGLDREKDQIVLQAEQVIRNYDPCISCATHFLQLDIRR
jgi:coenzyme F420-reducing hydrogenase alpha subunit